MFLRNLKYINLSAPLLGNTFLPPKRNLFDKFKGHRKQNAPLGLSPKVLRQNMTNSAKQNRKQELQTVPPKQNAYKHAPSIYLSMCVYGRQNGKGISLISRPPSCFLCSSRRARMQILWNRQGANFLKFPTPCSLCQWENFSFTFAINHGRQVVGLLYSPILGRFFYSSFSFRLSSRTCALFCEDSISWIYLLP